ncbi:MAG: DarT ssDNA thymidine ADP-ribosyltransferase family protein [Polyangiaceae bacterium]
MDGHRRKKLLYHLTALANLPSILNKGLQSRKALTHSFVEFEDVADPSILTGRADHRLDTFVPFHFLPRNPFDYAVVKRRTREQFVLIAVQRTVAASKEWRIVPRHPLADGDEPEILGWADGIAAIDWEQMDKDERDYDTDHDCKMVCMAEALSPKAVTVADFHSIFVATPATESAVKRALAGCRSKPFVNVNPKMFPSGAR